MEQWLDKKVTLIATGIQGTVVDYSYNGKYWIQADITGDWHYASDADFIETEIVTASMPHITDEVLASMGEVLTREDLFEQALSEKEIEWDGYREDGAVTYCIAGGTYSVMCTLDSDGTFELETTHQERMEQADDIWTADIKVSPYANRVTRKTIKGAINYIIKYMEV